MRRVLLLSPPQHCLEETVRIWTFSYAANFPLSLLRLSTWLKSTGAEVEVLDAFNVHPNVPASLSEVLSSGRVVRHAPCGNFASERRTKPVYHVGLTWGELEERLSLARSPDEVWISSIFTWSWQTTHRAVELVRKVHPRAHVRLGGIYPTLCPEKAATTGAEVVAGPVAEAETAWLDADLLAGVPALDGVVLKTSLGCPNVCSYCAVHLLEGRRFVFREAKDVVAELTALSERFGFRQAFFWESNLLLNARRHVLPILEALASSRAPFSVQAPEGLQPDLVTPQLAALMRATGFRQIRLTQETTDPALLSATGRPTDLAHLERAIRTLLDAGFAREDLSVVLLVGQPGQTLAGVLADVVRVYRLGVKATFLVYSPIPGTRDFTTYADRLAVKPLEDMDSFLYPFASPELTVAGLDATLKYFNDRWFPLARIRASETDDPLIRSMQELIRDGRA